VGHGDDLDPEAVAGPAVGDDELRTDERLVLEIRGPRAMSDEHGAGDIRAIAEAVLAHVDDAKPLGVREGAGLLELVELARPEVRRVGSATRAGARISVATATLDRAGADFDGGIGLGHARGEGREGHEDGRPVLHPR